MLTADECRELSCKAESKARQENDEWMKKLWRDLFPETERILRVISREIEEEIKFNCTIGRYSADIRIMDKVTFYLGNARIKELLREKILAYIIDTIHERYISNGFKVELSDDDKNIEIRWS